MSLQNLRDTLLWCFIINYGVLIFWTLTVVLHWDWPYELSAKLFNVPREKVNSINFTGIVIYKSVNICFFLVPYLALLIVNPH